VEPVADRDREVVGTPLLVERDGLADVVHDDLARIAAGHVLLELVADGRIHRAIHVFIQEREQVFAFHRRCPESTEPPGG
jgi:hypothetical protein